MSVNVKTEDDSDISQFHLAIDYSQNNISSLPTNSETTVIETTSPSSYPVVVPEDDTVVKPEPIDNITFEEPKKHKSKHRSKDKEKKKKRKHRHKDKNVDDNPEKHKRKHKSKHKHRSKKSKSSKTQVKEEESQLNPPSHDATNEAIHDAISQVPSGQMPNETDTSLNGINESLAGSMKRHHPLQDSELPARKIQRLSPEIPDHDSSQISNTHDADITNRTEVPDSQPDSNGNGIKTEYEVPENGAIHSDEENYSQEIQPRDATDSENSEGIAQDNDVPYNMTDEEHENNTDFESPPSNITTKRQARIRAQESLRKHHELEKSRLLQQDSDEEDEMFDKYIPDYEDDDSEQEYRDEEEEEEDDDDEEIVDSEEEEYSQSSQADLVQVPNGIPVDTLDEIEKSKREIKPSLELIKNLQPKVATVPSSHSFYQEIEIPLSIKIDKTPLSHIKPVKKGIVENLPDFTPQELENKDKRNNPYKENVNHFSLRIIISQDFGKDWWQVKLDTIE
ncbi:hypothetical protein QCA50_012294 [Cerrena zonata]|uniref:Uncharacterized protein n=1 Tax=Cerrena zonata TaxID=2478898 RepID=A0AAW0FV36_9APHY